MSRHTDWEGHGHEDQDECKIRHYNTARGMWRVGVRRGRCIGSWGGGTGGKETTGET